MNHSLWLATAGMATLSLSSGASAQTAPAGATATKTSRVTNYDAAFFAQYAPRTALDVVQRIPGFTLDLGVVNTGNNNTDVRGFAGVAGNVVVNGQRPSTKSETLDVYLTRIPASRIKRVEVAPGDLYGADYASKSQVANLILAEGGAGVAGNVTITAERHFGGKITPTASGSLSFSRGPSTFNIAGDTALLDLGEEGFDRVTDVASGAPIEFRRKVNLTRNYSPFVAASWALDNGPTETANLNVRYHFDRFHLLQLNHVFPADGPEHFDTLLENYPTRVFEIGGDVTRPLAGGAVKVVGLASRQMRRTIDEYDAGNLDHSQIVGGSQQLSRSQRNETLGRLTWSKSKLLGFQVEAGGEFAWNTLTDNLDLFEFGEDGSKTRIDLPIDHAKVSELRGEFWINGSRSFSNSLTASLGLNYEFSDLKVTGDATAHRRLKFFKPTITLDWEPVRSWHTQLIVRRTVAQLDFFDFVSVADLASNQINGGNANLEPQRDWEGRFSIEHPIFRSGKARLELGYDHIDMLQDRILTPQGFDAPGNIGTGKRMYADLTLDAPLDRFWKGLRVKLHGNLQSTQVRDPISGDFRDFSGFFPRWQWDIDVRRDLGKLAYGFTMNDSRRTTLFRTDVLDLRRNLGFPYTYAFVEYRTAGNQSLKLYLDDISNTGAIRDLLIFSPNRTAGEASVLEHRFRNSHIRVGFTFKQSFGGGATKVAAKDK